MLRKRINGLRYQAARSHAKMWFHHPAWRTTAAATFMPRDLSFSFCPFLSFYLFLSFSAFFFLSILFFLSLLLSLYIPLYLSICLSLCIPLSLFIYLSILLSVCLFESLSLYFSPFFSSLFLSFFLSFFLPLFLSLYLFRFRLSTILACVKITKKLFIGCSLLTKVRLLWVIAILQYTPVVHNILQLLVLQFAEDILNFVVDAMDLLHDVFGLFGDVVVLLPPLLRLSLLLPRIHWNIKYFFFENIKLVHLMNLDFHENCFAMCFYSAKFISYPETS